MSSVRAFALIALTALVGCRCGPGTAPTVSILSPRDFTVLEGVGPHAVRGEVTDPDEVLPFDRVTWRSDRDGVVARGAIADVVLSAGEHRLSLEAVDRDGLTGSAQVSVFVRAPGPVIDGGVSADAGVDLDGGPGDGGLRPDGGPGPDGGVTDTAPVVTISQPLDSTLFDQGQAFDLVGSALDAEEGPLSGGALVWTSDRAGVIGSGARVSFTNAALGVHRIVLTATDRSGRSGLAAISITIVPPGANRPPAVTISTPTNGAQLTVGVAAMLQGSAVDPEDGALSGTALRWRSSLGGPLGTGGALTTSLAQGVHTLTLTATDSMGLTGSASVTVSVNQANNQAPMASITAPASMLTVFEGASVSFEGTGTDPEDGALSGMALSWSSSLDGALGTGSPLVTTALTAGDHTVTLVVRDSGGNTGTATAVVRVLPMNRPPSVAITAPTPGTSVTAGAPLTFTGTAVDPEDGALSGASVRWSSSRDGALGTGLALTTASLSVGAHTITLTATDAGGRSASVSIAVTVTMSTMNVPPLARLTGPGAGQATDRLTFDGSTSSDSDGMVVSYRFDFGDGSMPVTSAMSTAAHTFTTAGTYTVTLTVTDDRGATGTATLQVVVSAFVRLPVVVTPATGDVGTACALATPGSRVFLAWTSARHPSVNFGEFASGVLSAEVVDGLGFNTGGNVSQHVSMQLDASNTPHLVYVRDGQVVYATKQAGAWVRERVDSDVQPLSRFLSSAQTAFSAPSVAVSAAGVSVLYATGSGSSAAPYRPVVAVRGSGAWTRSVVPAAGTSCTSCAHLPVGDLVIDASGRHLFPSVDETFSLSTPKLNAWTSGGVSSLTSPSAFGARTSLALAGPGRLLTVSSSGVLDVTLAAAFASSTATRSTIETFSAGQVAIAADQAGLPRVLVAHGGALEHLTATANPAFWEREELGPVDVGLLDVSVDGANATRACFIRAGRLMLY